MSRSWIYNHLQGDVRPYGLREPVIWLCGHKIKKKLSPFHHKELYKICYEPKTEKADGGSSRSSAPVVLPS